MKLRIFTIPTLMLMIAFSCQAQHPVTPHGVKLTLTANPAADQVDQIDIMRGTVSGGPYTVVACTFQNPTPGAGLNCLDPMAGGTVVDNKFWYIAQSHNASGWSNPTAEINPKGTVPTTVSSPANGTFAAAVQ